MIDLQVLVLNHLSRWGLNLQILRISLVWQAFVLQFKGKWESWADTVVRYERHFAEEFSDDLLRDDKAKTNSVFVQLLSVFHESKQLKELFLFLYRNSYASIFDMYFEILNFLLLNNLNNNNNASTGSEL